MGIFHWRGRRKRQRQDAQRLYQAVLEASRRPMLFTAGGIPDTLDGRFESLAIHMWLTLRRLKEADASWPFMRFLNEAMMRDLDNALREIGASDPGMGRKMKHVLRSFYGRMTVYDQGIDD